MAFLSSTWTKLKETVGKMSRLAKILALTAIVLILVFSIVMAVVLNRVNYVPLYAEGELGAEEAGTIYALLEEQGENIKLENTTTILVPEEDADRLRISLAAQGYPEDGLDYSPILEDGGFGSTDAMTQQRMKITLEGNLRASLNTMYEKVKNSVVIVNLATQSSYVSSSNRTPASASVILELEAGEELTNAEARSIAEFVMRSVPTLTEENLSITDSQMKSYDISANAAEMDTTELSQQQIRLAEEMKDVLEQQVLNILEPAMGTGNVAVSVNLALDFDETTISSVEFAPPVDGMEEGLLRSSEELMERLWSFEDYEGVVGAESNGLPGTEYVYDYENGNLLSESYSEIYNYELNEVQTQIEKAQGSITDLSVAVVINSEKDYASQVLEEVENLVANAIGVNVEYISAAALPFVESADPFAALIEAQNETMRELNRSQLIRTVIIAAVVLIIAAMVLLFLKKIFFPKKEEPEEAEEAADAAGAEAVGGAVDVVVGDEYLTEDERREKLIAGLKQKSESVQKVEDLMHADMDAVVQIIRSWLNET